MAAAVSESKLTELEFLKRLFSLYEVLSRQKIELRVTDKLYGELLGLVTKELSCKAGSLFVVDKETGSPTFTAVRGGDEGLVGKKLEKGNGIVGKVAQTGTAYLSRDVSKDRTWMAGVSKDKDFSVMDILACPIKYGDEVIGVVEVLNRKRGSFNRNDMKKLQGLTPHIAVFMKYFIDEIERQRFVEMQTKLYELSMVLNSNLDTKAVVRDAMNAIVSLVNADVGSLMLVDKEKQELFFEVALGDKEKVLKQIRLKFGQGVAGWVAQQRQPVIVNDPANDARFYRKADEKTGFVTKNILCVPVLSKGEVIGVIQALNRKEGLFTDHDLRFLVSLSAQIAIALENASLHEELKRTFIEVVETLAEAIEKRDPYTGGHTKRVVKYSLMIADEMGVHGDERDRLRMAALLHDVGKIGIDDSVLRKPARLDEAEFEKMKAHPSIGADMLGKISQISTIIPGILYHHEWYNGKGYPDGISGERLPQIAKIISIADTYDAMTTDRPYRKGLTHEFAIAELRKFSGTQFDPAIVEVFIGAFEKTKTKG